VLGITAVVQVVIVAASGSVALLSDTVHNFADAVTAVPLGLVFWLGRRPTTRRYTIATARSEDLAGMLVVATIAVSARQQPGAQRLPHPGQPARHPPAAVLPDGPPRSILVEPGDPVAG
jgi:hypothetical protein